MTGHHEDPRSNPIRAVSPARGDCGSWILPTAARSAGGRLRRAPSSRSGRATEFRLGAATIGAVSVLTAYGIRRDHAQLDPLTRCLRRGFPQARPAARLPQVSRRWRSARFSPGWPGPRRPCCEVRRYRPLTFRSSTSSVRVSMPGSSGVRPGQGSIQRAWLRASAGRLSIVRRTTAAWQLPVPCRPVPDDGNLLIFITPIETMLAEPVSAASSSATKSSLTALTYSGVAGPVATALRSAARRAGRQLIVSPGATRSLTLDASAGLQPGSSVAAGVSSGAVAIAAVGTVTYVDGNRIWAFGHPFDGTGRRSLLLQNAYVHAVVGNPLTLEEATPYKLASVLGPVGTLTDDRPAGVSGVLGVLPRTFPVTVSITNTDTGKLTTERTEVTDELDIGAPGGGTALEQVGPIAVAQAAYNALHGAPSQMTGRMCVRIKIAERKKTLGFCNRYVGAGPTSPGGAMPADISTAVTALGSYRFAPLRVTDVSVQIRIGAQPGLA